MRDRKPYCREGESDSTVALGFAVVWFFTFLLALAGTLSLVF